MKRWFNHTHSVLIIWSMFAICQLVGMVAVAESAEKTTLEKLTDPLYLLWFFISLMFSVLAWSLGRNIRHLDDRIKSVVTADEKLTEKYDSLARDLNRLLGEHDQIKAQGGHK
jgi:hypothetical protein